MSGGSSGTAAGPFRGGGRHVGVSCSPLDESNYMEVRYLDIDEDDPLDETQFGGWAKQARQLPGWDGA